MTKRSMVKITLAVLALALFSSVGASAQDCSKMTDAEIVKAIYDKMKKKPKLDAEIMHVNVRSKDGVITLEGWTTSQKNKKAIVKIAEKIKCKKQVINELADSPVGCGPGQKSCGTICIGIEEECNICTAKVCP